MIYYFSKTVNTHPLKFCFTKAFTIHVIMLISVSASQ